MNDYISKPIDPEELFRALLKWIRPTLKAELEELENDFNINNASSTADDLPVIDGLDTQLGMKRVLGKKALYFNMLKNYVNGQETLPTTLADALNTGDFETAQRLAHTAKSTSGNIGAMTLYNLAAHLETLIAQKVELDKINDALAHFTHLQSNMIDALKNVLAQAQPEQTIQHLDVEKAQHAVKRLKMLLEDDDMAALTFLNENSTLLSVSLGENTFTHLARLVKNVDFEKACECIDQANTSI